MQKSFKAAMTAVLKYEGGKVDDPRDPGGRTNQGVTQKVFNAYLASKKKPMRDVYSMTATERDDIYRARYWNLVSGDKLPPGVDFVVFDGAVNSGVAQSVKWLQRSLIDFGNYSGKVDGVMGIMTLNAVAKHPDHDQLVALICARRMAFLKSLRTWKTYGRGWSIRVSHVEAMGQAMAMGSVGPEIVWSPDYDAQPSEAGALQAQAAAKANVEDMKSAPPRAIGDLAAGAGAAVATGTTTLSSTIDGIKAQLEPFGGIEHVQRVLLMLTVAAVVITVGGLLYRGLAAARKRHIENVTDTDPARV